MERQLAFTSAMPHIASGVSCLHKHFYNSCILSLSLTHAHTHVHTNDTVDSFEPKTMVTRKLRRRPHDPLPAVEKRRKLTPVSSLVYVLDEGEVDEDLKVIFKVRNNH